MRMYTRDVYTRDVYRQTTRADAVEIRQSDLNTSGDIRTRPGGQRWFPPDFSKRFFLPSFLSFFFLFSFCFFSSFHREIRGVEGGIWWKIERIRRSGKRFFGKEWEEFSNFVENSIWIFEYWSRGGGEAWCLSVQVRDRSICTGIWFEKG